MAGRSGALAPFFARLRRARRAVLMLDYDGTLAPFAIDPDRAYPYPGVSVLIDQIVAQGRTRVVLVSGRAAAEVAKLIGLALLPEIWGSHGWEHLDIDGNYSVAPLDPFSLQRLGEARQALDRLGPGTRCEEKPVGLAVHWRGLAAGDVAAIHDRVMAAWGSLVSGTTLEICAFDGGIELRPRGRDKGFVVDGVLAQEKPEVAAAYLGDDLTDEDAFRAIGGRGLAVLVRPEWRDTLAGFWLKPPEELVQFLCAWRAATRSQT